VKTSTHEIMEEHVIHP